MEKIEVTINGKTEYIEVHDSLSGMCGHCLGSSVEWKESIKGLGGKSSVITITSDDIFRLDNDIFEDDMEFYLRRGNKLYFRKGKNKLVLGYEATPEAEAQIKTFKYHQIVHVTGRFEDKVIL